MTELSIALQTLKDAEDNVKKIFKEELGAVLAGICANPAVVNFAWTHKHSEYDDEGMNYGVSGPVFNREWEPNKWGEFHYWEHIDYYSKYDEFPREGEMLKGFLESVDPKLLCEVLGGDQTLVIVRNVDGRADIECYESY